MNAIVPAGILTSMVVTDETALANLASHADHARGALAPATERALRDDTALFTSWCLARGLRPLPAAPGTVAAFIDDMATTRAPGSVRRYVSSISSFHKAARVENPAITQEVKFALKRMHRTYGRMQKQAGPLSDLHVARMIAAGGTALRDLRNRALLTVAYCTLARRSELAALLVEDLEISDDGWAAVQIRRSKSDQEGAGMLRIVTPDAMRHLRAWIEAAGITEGPLFRSVKKGGHPGGALDGGDIPEIYRGMATAAGLAAEEVARISGHSTRVGAACDLVRYGQQLPAIMQAGGWTSPAMVGRYSARLTVRQSAAAQVTANRIAF